MDLQKRIEQLERERWLYLILASLGAVAGLVGVTLAIMKFTRSEFVVTDSKNNRAVLGTDPGSKELGLRLYNGAFLRGSVAMAENGTPIFAIYDAAGKRRQVMYINKDNFPTISMLGSDETVKAEFKGETTGGVLRLLDTSNNQNVITATGQSAAPTKAAAPAPAAAPATPPATKAGT